MHRLDRYSDDRLFALGRGRAIERTEHPEPSWAGSPREHSPWGGAGSLIAEVAFPVVHQLCVAREPVPYAEVVRALLIIWLAVISVGCAGHCEEIAQLRMALAGRLPAAGPHLTIAVPFAVADPMVAAEVGKVEPIAITPPLLALVPGLRLHARPRAVTLVVLEGEPDPDGGPTIGDAIGADLITRFPLAVREITGEHHEMLDDIDDVRPGVRRPGLGPPRRGSAGRGAAGPAAARHPLRVRHPARSPGRRPARVAPPPSTGHLP